MAVSEIKQAMIAYKSNKGVNRDQLVNKMISILDTNKSGNIDAEDNISDSWKEIFGFSTNPTAKFDKATLTRNIDDLANYIIGGDVEISEDLPPFNKDNLKIDEGATYGNAIYKQLKDPSTDGNYKVATSYLECVNKNNVIGFIEGFKAQSGDDGIMEFMDDEYGASELKGRARIPAALCELAVEVGVTDSPAYKYVKSAVDGYIEDQGSGWKNSSVPFKNGSHKGGWSGAGAGAAAGASTGAAIGTVVGGGVFSWATAGLGALIGGVVGAIGGGVGLTDPMAPFVDDEAEILDAQMEALVAEIKAKIGMEAAPAPTAE